MNNFINYIKRNCFIGTKVCNQGGFNPPKEEVINGVVNNDIQIVHNGIIVVHNGV